MCNIYISPDKKSSKIKAKRVRKLNILEYGIFSIAYRSLRFPLANLSCVVVAAAAVSPIILCFDSSL